MIHDPEIIALNKVFTTFRTLENGQRRRIVKWLKKKYAIEKIRFPIKRQHSALPKTVHENVQHPAIPNQKPLAAMETKKRAGRPRKKRIYEYDTALDAFSKAKVESAADKVILMAALLQERFNFKEIGTYDINFRLKRINQPIKNISNTINEILNMDPPILAEIRKKKDEEDLSSSKYSRKRFRVTQQGLRFANRLLP